MSWDFVTIEKPAERIAVVRFDSGHKANALSAQVMAELTAAARSFEDDTETSAVVLAGRADVFSLGRDLKDPALNDVAGMSLAKKRKIFSTGRRLTRAWEDMEPVTIAAIDGWCVGGGVALSVALDLRVLAADGHMYVPEVERGFNMSWQTVPRFVNLMGPSKSKRFMLLAEKLDAETSLDWGLVDEIAPAGGAYPKAMEWAERIASMPPVAVRMIKRGVDTYANALANTATAQDADQFGLIFESEDRAEAVAAFLEGREANYKGR